ncbi:Uncharacterized protein TCM_025411 [Theobroma cacao]|uniref:Uncharacterized protein n=1 Tax=Theobroma cacao TaxID=3641 RepID=A0A061F684_THECC|nr:Uncharacterized protein TCM_025411 [Theobroma cacao]
MKKGRKRARQCRMVGANGSNRHLMRRPIEATLVFMSLLKRPIALLHSHSKSLVIMAYFVKWGNWGLGMDKEEGFVVLDDFFVVTVSFFYSNGTIVDKSQVAILDGIVHLNGVFVVMNANNKQSLKESLQEAASVSNRNPTPSAAKGKPAAPLVLKTASLEIDIMSKEGIQTRENNVALMESSGMATQRNLHAPVEIALASQTWIETIPITTSLLLPQQRANVEKIGVGINGVARVRECPKVDEGSHVRTEDFTSSIEMELEIREEDIMQD